jgi:hypothetical protein
VKSGIGVTTAWDALMSRSRRLEIEGGVFLFTLTLELADLGDDLLVRLGE